MATNVLTISGALLPVITANGWHESPAAKALLEKHDAFVRCSDHWSGEASEVAKAFSDAATDIELQLDDLRSNAVTAVADATGAEEGSDPWWESWDEADEDAPPVPQAIRQAHRMRVGERYLERMGS